MWQDYFLTAISLFFCVTLIPMFLAKEKPPLATSISTGFALLAGAAVYATMHLWLSAGFQSVVGIEWFLLAWQRWHAKN